MTAVSAASVTAQGPPARADLGNAIEVDGVLYVAVRFLLENPEHGLADSSMLDDDVARLMHADDARSPYRSELRVNGRHYIAIIMHRLDPHHIERAYRQRTIEVHPRFIPQRLLDLARVRYRTPAARILQTELEPAAVAPPGEVPVRDDISHADFYHQFFRQNRPCIIRGAAADWPAMARWRDDDHLRRVAGSAAIKRTISIRRDLGFSHMSPMEVIRLDEFLDRYRDDPRDYINDSDIPRELLGELGRHTIHRAFDDLEEASGRMGLFMGIGGQRAPLHYDDEENLYTVVDGEKRFTLFDPADFCKMYANDHRRGPDFSAADPDDYDEQEYPLLPGATRYDAHLAPGDVLYVPGYWWHSVASVGRNIAVSQTCLDRLGQLAVFIKLVQQDALPLSTEHKERLLAMIERPVETARRTAEELELDRLLANDLFTLYLRLGLLYTHHRERGHDLTAITAMYDAIRGPVARRIRDADWSYPVLYLMQNFYRCETGIFTV